MSVDLTISKVDEADPSFWPIIGPIVTSPVILKLRKGKGIPHESGSVWHVACRDGRVVGFTIMRLRPVKEAFVKVEEMQVDPLLRGGSVPRALLRASIAASAERWAGLPIKIIGDGLADVIGLRALTDLGFTRDAEDARTPFWIRR